jgi:hypothetical protein
MRQSPKRKRPPGEDRWASGRMTGDREEDLASLSGFAGRRSANRRIYHRETRGCFAERSADRHVAAQTVCAGVSTILLSASLCSAISTGEPFVCRMALLDCVDHSGEILGTCKKWRYPAAIVTFMSFRCVAAATVIFPLRAEKTVVIETRAPEGLCARNFHAVLGRGYGEIGRHARFRFWCRKAWEFKSLYPHQFRGRFCRRPDPAGGQEPQRARDCIEATTGDRFRRRAHRNHGCLSTAA